MRRLSLIVVAAFAVVGITTESVQAGVIAPGPLRAAESELPAVQTVQFMWRGRRYCWYSHGWRGPGWYRCGFQRRRGLGWGGPSGWHGWRTPGLRRPATSRPRVNRRRGTNRPGANRPSRPDNMPENRPRRSGSGRGA